MQRGSLKKCGWDKGDCFEFNKKYPTCIVHHPTEIGDGQCFDYGNYNTKKCAWDGGDCIIHNFKKKHPNCIVDDYEKIGDGKCNKELDGYNSKECGWDNGDCLSPGAIAGIVIGSLSCVIFVSCLYFYRHQIRTRIERFHYRHRSRREQLRLHRSHQRQVRLLRRSKQSRSEFERERRTAMFPSVPVMAINEEEQGMNRHTLVLTSIMYKKAISSESDDDEQEFNKLPHETIISKRSTRRTKWYEMQLLENEDDKAEDDRKDLEAQQSILQQKKHDIMIETLRSIRPMNTNFKPNSIGSNGNNLYNPKVCPICCEEYVKGDGIAWSKNEECVHAFHTDCIVPWLMEHSDCPMCRNDYLCLSS